MTSSELALKLFLQLAVILGACSLVGRLGRRFGQTQVVGEMAAGVLLGPSLLGLVAPALQGVLFPLRLEAGPPGGIQHPSMSILQALSQLGVTLYMFIVGLEFNTDMLRGRLRGAALVSAAGIVAPFLLGCGAAVLLSGRVDMFAPGVPLWIGAVFLGSCMSITAFPMLARILRDKGIASGRLGTLALAAGSIDDAAAWCLLALVLGCLKGSPAITAAAVGGGALYVLVMLRVARPLLARLGERAEREGGVTGTAFTLALLVLFLGAASTQAMGLHAVFGAFIAGAAMPRGRFARDLATRMELAAGLLLPVFFVSTGLDTRIGLLDSGRLWAAAGLVVILAVAGKGAACALGARAAGEPWREAATIGTLMNARGLMELIILGIGLQERVITPTLFTMMVLMAVVTTLMTSPLFELIYGRHAARSARDGGVARAAAVAAD